METDISVTGISAHRIVHKDLDYKLKLEPFKKITEQNLLKVGMSSGERRSASLFKLPI